MTVYNANDLHFSLPDGTLQGDMTVNILKLPSLKVTVVVTRAPFEEATLEESFNNQMQKLQRQVKGYKFKNKETLKLATAPEIECYQIQNEFTRMGEKIFQIQCAFALPETKNMVAFGYVKHEPLTDEDLERWSVIRDSIQLSDFQ